MERERVRERKIESKRANERMKKIRSKSNNLVELFSGIRFYVRIDKILVRIKV